jgi:hypothetical protein
MRSVALAILVVAGCSNASSTLVDPGPAPANGMQLVLPVVKGIESGSSVEYCTWTDTILDHDIYVKHAQVFQSLGGHHVVLFYTTKYQDPGTQRVCTDADMATFRFAVGAAEKAEVTAPGDLVFKIPAGAQLVANQHFLNATPHSLDIQSAVNIDFADPGAKMVEAGSLVFLDDSMVVHSGAQSLDVNCTMNSDQPVWQLFPHMHEWGTHMTITHTRATTQTTLYDGDWSPEYVFHPPTYVTDPSTPFMFAQGDQVKLHCEWNNDSGHDLSFGLEMCVAFAQTVNPDDKPNVSCDKGNWGTF